MPTTALQGALMTAFSVEELRVLASTRLGVEPEAVWGEHATVGEAAMELVGWARRHDRLCDLASGAAQERPGNQTLQAVARLMPLVCEGGRRVGTAAGNVERWESVQDPGIDSGVQNALGRLTAQMEAVQATQRVQTWLLILSLAGNAVLGWLYMVHVWGV